MQDTRIIIVDGVSKPGLEPLRDAGFKIDDQTGLGLKALRIALRECVGLIVRSETIVTADLIDHALNLRVIGRAGVGVDNIDVPQATARGIVVMNAPDGNTITTAEHTIAMMIASARCIPQANSSLKAGLWERKRFVGAEMQGKTLGIIGLGRIGSAVAQRARALGMNILVYDPFISHEHSRTLQAEIVSLSEVFVRADVLTIHTPLTPDTRGIIGSEAFAKMKRGVRIINCARGGLVDEQALFEAIQRGIVAGAAIDVFEQEPPDTSNSLLALDQVIVTPHLGASTREAQDLAAFTIAEQMRDYLVSGASRGAVNLPPFGVQELIVLQPYMELADQIGRLQAQLVDEAVARTEIEFIGPVVDTNAEPVTRAFLTGLLSDVSVRVNVVNAFDIAKERGIENNARYLRGSVDLGPKIVTRVTTKRGEQTVTGTMLLSGRGGRITEINGFHLEAVPSTHMLVTHNRDVPGVVGYIGTVLGNHGVNIGQLTLGRRERGGEAMAVFEIDAPIKDQVLEELRQYEPLLSARQVRL